ncbi:MAG: TIGR02597 family protein [Verrucomicrobiales bacterium]
MKSVFQHIYEPTLLLHRTNPIASFFAILLFAGAAFGEVKSPIVGVSETSICNGGADTYFSLPLQPDVALAGTISEITHNSVEGETTITISGEPDLESDQFAYSAYLKFKTGRAAGRSVLIHGNASSQLIIEESVPARAGDAFEIVPGWSLGALFPPATQTTFHLSTGNLPAARGSELLLYSTSGGGVETSPSSVCFLTPTGWKILGGTFPGANDVVLDPSAVFAVRNPKGSADTTFSVTGTAQNSPRLVALKTLRGQANENFTGHLSATDRSLRSLGLKLGRSDRLLLFEKEPTALNIVPASEFRFDGRKWIDVNSNESANDITIPAGAALIVKKAPVKADGVVFWKQVP